MLVSACSHVIQNFVVDPHASQVAVALAEVGVATTENAGMVQQMKETQAQALLDGVFAIYSLHVAKLCRTSSESRESFIVFCLSSEHADCRQFMRAQLDKKCLQ